MFGDIIKIVTMFFETITKDSRKVKINIYIIYIFIYIFIYQINKLYIKIQSICAFLDVAKLADFR